MILNAIAVTAPISVLEKIRSLTNIAYIENNGSFSRPVLKNQLALNSRSFELISENLAAPIEALSDHNSVKFIGATAAQSRNIRGQNMRIGIIDTGIDYTHAMLGGAGTEAAYKAVDPKLPNSGFPNSKVIGGLDLVGTEFDSAAGDFMRRLPVPDENPLDEAGHGTHVSGTVAGHGDGINTYDGVAPDASLFAIKVFGKTGSTGDASVIAGLEYAADPNLDADVNDQLDAVNLSLGGGFGDPHILYGEAIRNLSRAGTVVVCSAGNSGDSSYIVGAPSVAEDAISVAASVDDMAQNYKFRAVKFSTTENPEIYIEAIEGTISKKIEDAGDVSGLLVAAGLADKDFSDELKNKIKGNIAFVDRGAVPFSDKLRRSLEAGAIGVVVANNQSGEPISMGGDGQFALPAIMVSKDFGDQLKASMIKGTTTIQFNTDRKIEKPELIDTITGFSSKGPRSIDALIKPEIAAPGSKVISAKMGAGDKGVQLSGTSMAAPHMTGVMALLKQTHPDLTSAQLKSLAMGTAKSLTEKNILYSVSRQGAGRIQVLRALDSSLISEPTALSLGELTVELRKTIARSIEIKNISTASLSLNLVFEGKAEIQMTGVRSVEIAPGATAKVDLRFTIDASTLKSGSMELDGILKFKSLGEEVLRIPVLAVANKVSQIEAEKLLINSTSDADSTGAVVDLTLRNIGSSGGTAYPFNLIGLNGRKEDSSHDEFRSKACDMEGAGYRIIKRDGASIIQFAVKLYEPVTTWDQCEVSVLIDSNGDSQVDQELVGAKQDHLKGLTKQTFASILLDAEVTRQIEKKYEMDSVENDKLGKKTELDFSKAVLELQPMLAFEHSTIAIIEAPVKSLKIRPSGELSIKIATSYQEGSAIQPDDFLDTKWIALSIHNEGAGYADLPEKIELSPLGSMTSSFTKGGGTDSLWILYPSNKSVVNSIGHDQQSQLATPVYQAAP